MKTVLYGEESIQGFLQSLSSLPITPASPEDAQKLLAPKGYRPIVELQMQGNRARPTKPLDEWSPETGEIHIYFVRESKKSEPASGPTESPQRPLPSLKKSGDASETSLSDASTAQLPAGHADRARSPEDELCQALEEVERLGRSFVALTWFRDDVLPSKGFAWAGDPDERQKVLAKAVESGAVLTSKIPNPRSPFPTTTIRLNRARVIGVESRHRFSPVRITGEPLSTTIRRDRGDL